MRAPKSQWRVRKHVLGPFLCFWFFKSRLSIWSSRPGLHLNLHVRVVRPRPQHRLPLYDRSHSYSRLQSRWNDAPLTRPGKIRVHPHRIVLNILGPDLHLHHESPVFPLQGNALPSDLILDEAPIKDHSVAPIDDGPIPIEAETQSFFLRGRQSASRWPPRAQPTSSMA